MYHILFIQSSVDEHLGFFWFGAYCGKKKKASMNIGVSLCVNVCFNFSGVIPMDGMARLYSRGVFDFLRNTL